VVFALGAIVARNAKQLADRPAITDDAQSITQAELAQRSLLFASAMHNLGLRKGNRVSMLSMNCLDFISAYIATSLGGTILNTVNFRLAAAEIAWTINDASPRIVIFEAQYSELIESLRESLVSVEHYICLGTEENATDWALNLDVIINKATPVDFPEPLASDFSCLMYTSGTTGKPKGVLHTNKSIARVAEVISSELGFNATTRLLAIAPLFHMGAATLSLAALFRGGSVVIHRSFDADAVIRTIEKEQINAIHMVPTMVQGVLDSPALQSHDISSLQMLMYAAAPMPLAVLKRAMAQFGPILYNGYGQTEINMLTLLHPHQHKPNGSAADLARLSSVGQPHWQCAIRIVDDAGNTLDTGCIGEIVAKSETAMAGYWNNSEATTATLKDDWIYTGDMGYLDDEGYLFLVDRKKDLIISGGENIYSIEVEDALSQHPAVHECAVIGLADEKWGEAVCAVVVFKENHTATPQELIDWSKTLIASFKAPKTVFIVNALPRLPTGKINKVAIRQQFSNNNAAQEMTKPIYANI
jgi:acyl-CoA synthetase (AMP-forming)/AMP-acid ligase II